MSAQPAPTQRRPGPRPGGRAERPRLGGIDLGGTKIEAIVTDDAHRVLGSARHPTPTSGGPTDVANAMADALREAARGAGNSSRQLRGVGVGSPGTIDSAAGTVSHADNLPGWAASFPLAATLQAALVPVALGNDVAVATNAEFELGAGRPYDSLLGVFWGTGVGGGLILGASAGAGAAPPARSGTPSCARTAAAARAAAAAASRPTPAARPWRRARGACTPAA